MKVIDGSEKKLVSICIPVYKRIEFLKRLLDSIVIQSFSDFEVIITDDSPDDAIRQVCEEYKKKIPSLNYYKNTQPLGTPANWNEAIRRATGDWIKLMHDDDWFAGPEALAKFAEVSINQENRLIFSSYCNFFVETGKERKVIPPAFRLRQLKRNPVTLLSKNIIGPPSVIMHRNDRKYWYDPELKWLVDIDMYIRRLEHDNILYLPHQLVKVGVSSDQVTVQVHGNPEVEIPEHFHFFKKTGVMTLKNILVYDYWWRFFRNFSLTTEKDIQAFGYDGPVHPVLQNMMNWQKKLPRFVLNTGMLSKFMMFIHFCLHRQKLVV